MAPRTYLSVCLARAGIAARRPAIELIKSGRVQCNGVVITDPAHMVDAHDSITVDGTPVRTDTSYVYIMLNKPVGYVCTHTDEHQRQTIFDLIAPADNVPGLTFVGRLDQDSSGLLLLTNDGQWAQRLQHPRFEIRKIYQVTVDQPLTAHVVSRLTQGTHLTDGFIQPDRLAVHPHDTRQIEITLHSGKKRIIRRLLAHYGYTVMRLHRVQYGPWKLEDLPSGLYRSLTAAERSYA